MTGVTAIETTMRTKLSAEQRTNNASDCKTKETGEWSDVIQLCTQRSSIKADQRQSKAGRARGKCVRMEQHIELMVTLFHDGFVCRHINKEKEVIDGFAQPYDAESSYFLACIDSGRVPEGLPDMIACAHYHGSILVEIRDYRETRTVLCPVSSAFLPATSTLPQGSDSELSASCHVWQTLLIPDKVPLLTHGQTAPRFEPSSLQSVFDHFPDVAPDELETLALDAKQQLLQGEDILLPSPFAEASSPRDEPWNLAVFPAGLQVPISEMKEAGIATTPTAHAGLLSELAISPTASLLLPIERECARMSLDTQEETPTKQRKRQVQTTLNKCNGNPSKFKCAYYSSESDAHHDQDMSSYESPFHPHSPCSGSKSRSTDDTASITPPAAATHLFLSKLKGKRGQPEDGLGCNKPSWVTIAHVKRFYDAATRLEREHSRFLRVNARRLMQAEKLPPADTEHVAGSMRYLSRQLHALSQPSDVIAVADARESKSVEDEGQKLPKSEWMGDGEGLSLTHPSTEAMIHAESDPTLHLSHTDNDQDILLGCFFELVADSAKFLQDSQSPTAAPHFNAFDDDGNLQLQYA